MLARLVCLHAPALAGRARSARNEAFSRNQANAKEERSPGLRDAPRVRCGWGRLGLTRKNGELLLGKQQKQDVVRRCQLAIGLALAERRQLSQHRRVLTIVLSKEPVEHLGVIAGRLASHAMQPSVRAPAAWPAVASRRFHRDDHRSCLCYRSQNGRPAIRGRRD